ncbi:MAG TPA: hypothetical protein VHK00_05225, partial [Miltoncostaeaceae bacterium]|nr:hypothetical protein [Miltoncostaeaceae bacterium]
DEGEPLHDRGIARAEPGLAFVGLPFQYAVSSEVLPGVGRDARRVARHISGLAAAGRRRRRARTAAHTTTAPA